MLSEVAQKLSEADKRMEQLFEAVEGQKHTISDNSGLVKNLLVGIENLGDNMKDMRKEMDYWRNPEVMEAEEELERLQDEVPLEAQVNSGPQTVTYSTPENQASFLAQRPNILPISGLENYPTASATEDVQQLTALRKTVEESNPISFVVQAPALQKPYLGASISYSQGDSV